MTVLFQAQLISRTAHSQRKLKMTGELEHLCCPRYSKDCYSNFALVQQCVLRARHDTLHVSSCHGAHHSKQRAKAHRQGVCIAAFTCSCTLCISNSVGCTLHCSVCVLLAACGIAVEECTREVVTLRGIRCIAVAGINVAPRGVAPICLIALRFLFRRSFRQIETCRMAWFEVFFAGCAIISRIVGEVRGQTGWLCALAPNGPVPCAINITAILQPRSKTTIHP